MLLTIKTCFIINILIYARRKSRAWMMSEHTMISQPSPLVEKRINVVVPFVFYQRKEHKKIEYFFLL
jgi:hypothetical protein